MLLLGCSDSALADDDGLASREADTFDNAFFLEQSYRDQRLWLGAFMTGAGNAFAMHNVDVGRCMARWYFDDEEAAYGSIIAAMERFPENSPVEVVFALARRECGDLHVSD